MSVLTKTLWVLAASCTVVGAAWIAGCSVDGVTPNCAADGHDCVTPPGDAAPSNAGDDAGTN